MSCYCTSWSFNLLSLIHELSSDSWILHLSVVHLFPLPVYTTQTLKICLYAFSLQSFPLYLYFFESMSKCKQPGTKMKHVLHKLREGSVSGNEGKRYWYSGKCMFISAMAFTCFDTALCNTVSNDGTLTTVGYIPYRCM